jgi:hypothetical protein
LPAHKRGTLHVKPASSYVTGRPETSAVVAHIHNFFDQYGSVFVDLAAGKRSDLEALLQFYGAPFRYIGEDFHKVMMDSAAITGPDGIGGEIAKLHHVHYSGSTLDTCEVTLLNNQAALVEATWLRRDQDGALMARFTVLYLVALTAEGWRITTAVNTKE